MTQWCLASAPNNTRRVNGYWSRQMENWFQRENYCGMGGMRILQKLQYLVSPQNIYI